MTSKLSKTLALSMLPVIVVSVGFVEVLHAKDPNNATTVASHQDMKNAYQYKGVYKVINAGGPGCGVPTKEEQKLLDRYGAWHYCFTYKFAAESDFFTDVTNLAYDVINVTIPISNFVELYQPMKSTLRFQAPQAKHYKLYKYWTHNLSNVPRPGKYTDHKFINISDRSIDYYWKLKQRRGLGQNARIAGVAEVVFVPDEMFDIAKQEGFLK